jgi:hypothetical protein
MNEPLAKPMIQRTGRPTLCTQELTERLADHIAEELTDEAAA